MSPLAKLSRSFGVRRLVLLLAAVLALALWSLSAQKNPGDPIPSGLPVSSGSTLGLDLAEGECVASMFFTLPDDAKGKDTPMQAIRVQPSDIHFDVNPVSEGRVLVEGYRDGRKVDVYDVRNTGAGWIPIALERAVSCDNPTVPSHDDPETELPPGEPRKECWPDC